MKFFYKDVVLVVPEDVYYPREDSIFLAEALVKVIDKENVKTCLDVGCGSGFLSIIMAKKKSIVNAVDINELAVKTTIENSQKNNVNINVEQGDLFSLGKYDLIVFNPPYLPEGKEEYMKYIGKEKNQ